MPGPCVSPVSTQRFGCSRISCSTAAASERNELRFFTSATGVNTSLPSVSVSLQLMLGSNRMCPRIITPPVAPTALHTMRMYLPYATASSGECMSGSDTISNSGVPARFRSTSE